LSSIALPLFFHFPARSRNLTPNSRFSLWFGFSGRQTVYAECGTTPSRILPFPLTQSFQLTSEGAERFIRAERHEKPLADGAFPQPVPVLKNSVCQMVDWSTGDDRESAGFPVHPQRTVPVVSHVRCGTLK
jgi:hypothetical protein